MTDINVRTHVDMALESGNRVDSTEAKAILDTILADGVTPDEYAQVKALHTDAARQARGTAWAAVLGLNVAGQLKAAGEDETGDAMLGLTKVSLDQANDFRDFTEKLFNDIDAEFNKPLNRVARFASSVWTSVFGK